MIRKSNLEMMLKRIIRIICSLLIDFWSKSKKSRRLNSLKRNRLVSSMKYSWICLKSAISRNGGSNNRNCKSKKSKKWEKIEYISLKKPNPGIFQTLQVINTRTLAIKPGNFKKIKSNTSQNCIYISGQRQNKSSGKKGLTMNKIAYT